MPSCDRALPASAFGRNRARPDGLSFYCLDCNRARMNRWYRERRRQLGKEVKDLSWLPEGFRWCPACKQAVPHDMYTRNSRTASGFASRCKACKSAADSAGYFYRKYKLIQNQVADLRAAQGDRCAICGEPAPQHLDHDHETGTTRELLCQRCNNGLGLFRDDPRLLHAAAYYVELHTARHQVAAEMEAIRAGAEGRNRPGEPPVGSHRRPGPARSTRGAGRSSDRRRRDSAGEADE